MTTPQETIWEIERHTQAKHEILRRYLGAWFPILGRYNQRIIYIDGFCGPGRYKGGEQGSPIIALQEAAKHTERLKDRNVVFLFMDERPDRIAHLESELLALSIPNNFSVHIGTGQFDQHLGKLLNNLDSNGMNLAPTFAFIDPFGFKGLPFDLVKRLLQNRATEVFVNVMVESINRFLEHPDTQIRRHIVDLFGTPNVLQLATQSNNRMQELRLLYQKQLSQHAKFVRFFEMQDCNGRTIYYLFFAGNNSLGHTRMKEAFWAIDPTSGFCFSDATNPNQPVLFQYDPTFNLTKELSGQFANQTLSVEHVQKYVEEDTPFIAKHMRDALKKMEDDKSITVHAQKQNGSKRKRNTFPSDAIIDFKQIMPI